jgi:hypothetical protein
MIRTVERSFSATACVTALGASQPRRGHVVALFGPGPQSGADESRAPVAARSFAKRAGASPA